MRTTPLCLLIFTLILTPREGASARLPSPEKAFPKVDCTSFEKLNSEIRWCNENNKAVFYAEDCAKRLSNEWDSASRGLREIKEIGKSQLQDFQRTNDKYNETLRKMANLTKQLVNNANLIARYPEALADKPQRIDLTDSLPCYQDAFAKIQRVVNDLDKRSREGVAALRAASELQRSSDSRSTKLASGPDTINRDVRSTSSAQRIPAFVKKENRQSDITGTDQKLPVSEGIFKH